MTALGVKRIGLLGGPLLGLLCYFLLPLRYAAGPEQWFDFLQAGRATLGLMVWMAAWWLTEAVDIEATALIGLAIERRGLDRRMAFSILMFGTGPVRLPQMMKAGVWLNLAGIMVITALVTLLSATFLGHVFGSQP